MAKNISGNDRAKIDLLHNATVIAVVGHSDKPHRTSYRIAQYLRDAGYTVYPVNPTITHVDDDIISYSSLADVPEPIDIVNVFRRSEHVSGVVDDAIAVGAKSIWTQLEVIDEDAAARAVEHGLDVVMNRCIKVEHMRLSDDDAAMEL